MKSEQVIANENEPIIIEENDRSSALALLLTIFGGLLGIGYMIGQWTGSFAFGAVTGGVGGIAIAILMVAIANGKFSKFGI